MRIIPLLFLLVSCSLGAEGPLDPPFTQPPTQNPSQPEQLNDNDITLTAEGLPSSFVNHVNTIFGNFLLPTVDFVISGPTPLPLVRYYNSDSSQSKWLHGVGMSTNYPLWIRRSVPYMTSAYGVDPYSKALPQPSNDEELHEFHRWPTTEDDEADLNAPFVEGDFPFDETPQSVNTVVKRHDHTKAKAYAEEDGGSILSFSAGQDYAKDLDFYIDPETTHKGLTNVGVGEISARTNLKNTKFHAKNNKGEIDWSVFLSNGGERHYRREVRAYEEKTIREEIKPNGNKLLFTCGNHQKWGAPLQKIISANNKGNRHFGWLEVTYTKKFRKVSVHGSSNKYAVFFYERHATRNTPDAPYITKAFTSDQPDTRYEYSIHDGRRLMSKVLYPQGRFLHIKYDSEGRVEEQRAPVGPNNQEVPIYRFKYHPDEFHTTVYDANHNKTMYYYSSKKRLKSIVRLQNWTKLLREEKFFWGDREDIRPGTHDTTDEGHLLSRCVQDEQSALSCTRYFYDDFGNIIKETHHGNFTGTSYNHFFVGLDGRPTNPPEKYHKFAKYSNDRFHMCTEKSEDSGPTITFQYKENTDLLKAKFTQDGSQIKIREFFEYNDDGVLNKKILDDGSSSDKNSLENVTERRITYITPITGKEDTGIGLPEEVRECYVDLTSGNEILLHRTTYTYYRNSRVSKETHFDANNQERYSISYEYDRLGNIKKKAHSAGKEFVYKYDLLGNKIREELVGSGFHKEFDYDHANRLICEREVHAQGPTFTTSYTYDKVSNKTSSTDRFGQVTRYEHDGLGRVVKVLLPTMFDKDGKELSPTTLTSYDVFNQPIETTDQNGNVTTYKRTARGQPYLITYPDGSTECFVYNLNGTLAKKTDRHGVVTTYEYDFLHRVTKTIVNGTKITEHTYSAFHETSTKDPMGAVTSYRYDGAGRLIEKDESGSKTGYSYDEFSRKSSTKEYLEDGSFIEKCTSQDLFNRLIEEKTQHSDGTLLSLKQYVYDIMDNRIEVVTFSTEEAYNTERTEYNSQKLPVKYTDALGHTTLYEYDFAWKNEHDQTVLKKTTIDPLGNQTIEISDTFHRIERIEKLSSKGDLLAKTHFSFDAKGNKAQQKEFVYGNGILLREYVIEWTYTPTDLIATCTEEPGTLDEKKTSNAYTRGGLLETITKPDGVSVNHAYDDFSRLASISSSEGTIHYTYSYDLNDNVIAVEDHIHQLSHTKTYDINNRVLKDTIGTGVESRFSYNALDCVIGFSTGNRQIDYHYKSGRLHTVVGKDDSGVKLYTHTYDTFDLRGNVTKSSSISSCGSIKTTWDPLGRTKSILSDHFEENNLLFDDAGNLLEITQKDPQGTILSKFSYDDLYQLTNESGVLDGSYVNDSINNRLKKNDEEYTINDLNQLTNDGDTTYEYDKNGNPIKIGSMRLYYDGLDRLIMLERPGFSRSEYVYDESHRRISKKTFLWNEGEWQEEESLRFIFFNKREIGSLLPDGSTKEFRVLGLGKGAELGASIALEIDGKTFAPIHDHRGNITVLIDTETHQPSDTYRYSAFGEERVFGDTLNPWRFASKRTDAESSFVFFGRRYYSPTVGRFLTPDPLSFADGPNLYSYVHNSPLILLDPYGLFGMGGDCGTGTTFSPHPSITDPCGRSSGSGNSYWQPSDFPNYEPSSDGGGSSSSPSGVTAGSPEGVGDPQSQNQESGRSSADMLYDLYRSADSEGRVDAKSWNETYEKIVERYNERKNIESHNESERRLAREEGLVEMIDNLDVLLCFTPIKEGLGAADRALGSPAARTASYVSRTVAESRVGQLAARVSKSAYTYILEKMGISSGYKVGEYTLTQGVYKHLIELDRPFLKSPLLIKEIISTGKYGPDPKGLLTNALYYRVPGAFSGTEGTWQLLVDPATKTIYHFNFVTR